MKKILNGFIWMVSKIMGRKNLESLLVYLAKSANINLHVHGLLQIGAGTGVYLENESETFFIKNILAEQLTNNKCPVLFDVGANIGNYSLKLKEYITRADIYSFEPVKKTFEQLEKNIGNNTKLYNIGFGNLPGNGLLYNTINTTVSEIATAHKDILVDVFKNTEEIIATEFVVDTIDNFCRSNNIKNINFLKIDVEGNELSVLQGASAMLANDNIKIIQFEFNTHNVYARVFLRDFYLLLKDFELYRLKKGGMISLGNYHPINEIFTAQNLIAVHKTVSPGINGKYVFSI